MKTRLNTSLSYPNYMVSIKCRKTRDTIIEVSICDYCRYGIEDKTNYFASFLGWHLTSK